MMAAIEYVDLADPPNDPGQRSVGRQADPLPKGAITTNGALHFNAATMARFGAHEYVTVIGRDQPRQIAVLVYPVATSVKVVRTQGGRGAISALRVLAHFGLLSGNRPRFYRPTEVIDGMILIDLDGEVAE